MRRAFPALGVARAGLAARPILLLDISFERLQRSSSSADDAVGSCPEDGFPVKARDVFPEQGAYHAGTGRLQVVDECGKPEAWRCLNKQVDVITFTRELDEARAPERQNLSEVGVQERKDLLVDDLEREMKALVSVPRKEYN
jgi:hypothetical protein